MKKKVNLEKDKREKSEKGKTGSFFKSSFCRRKKERSRSAKFLFSFFLCLVSGFFSFSKRVI